jgi:coenzyme F420-dependent glucose-6-phosphate dehydrogenase
MTVSIGYALSSEERTPRELVEHARLAEQSGFEYALISDHFHPWLDEQGQSPFVWSVLGAIAEATDRIRIGTGVTCPTIRTHPAIVAQAAATTACLLPGRFFFGVGSGENLNEHILGDRWPSAEERLEMLEEAIGVIRELWEGALVTHRGKHYTVDRARLYSVPDEAPPLAIAASAKNAAEVAGKHGDALISTAPDAEVVKAFEGAGGSGKPKYGQIHVCVADSREQAIETAYRCWRFSALPGELSQELPLPRYFRQASETLTREQVAETVVCGNDPGAHREKIDEYADAGFDHVYVHQVGSDQEAFMRFYEHAVLPVAAR